MTESEIVEVINKSLIDFITDCDEHVDVFWLSLSPEELQVYQRESLKVGDKETSDKLLNLLKERGY